MKRVLVVNPNSTESCTAAIDRAADPFRRPDLEIVCETVAEGPASIATMTDHAVVQGALVQHLQRRNADMDAVVIACFSDPALPAAKEITGRPCFGLGESGMLAATQRGLRFGVVALADASVERHRRRVAELGIATRYAGSRPVSLSVPELADPDRTVDAMIAAGRRLVAEDGADCLVMGCAGMADYRETLADGAGVPVVEPGQAAVAVASASALQGW